jgi:Ca2+-binding EF-hand superfamily protein
VVFSLFDADQNGVIDAKEAKIFCQVMLNDEEGHQDVFKEADTDHSGSLSFDEVQQLLKKIRANIK